MNVSPVFHRPLARAFHAKSHPIAARPDVGPTAPVILAASRECIPSWGTRGAVGRFNTLRRGCPPLRARWPLVLHAEQTETPCADRIRRNRPTISPVSPLACRCVTPDDAHPQPAAPKRPEDPRPLRDAVSPVVAPRAETRCWAAARVSHSNTLHDHSNAHRLAVPTGELSPGLLHCSDEFGTSLLGNSAGQSIGELLLFLQGKPVGRIRSGCKWELG